MITSVRNRQVVAAARLRKRGIREQRRRFLVEGAQATAEALAADAVETLFHVPGAGGRVAAIVRQAADAGVPLTAVSDTVMSHITSTVTPQPLVGVARFVDVELDVLLGSDRIVPVLCSVRDPGNAGTIVRTADAAGAAGVVFAEASVDVYNPKTVRASAGSLFHLPVVREVRANETVAALRGGGARVLAASADGRASVFECDLDGPTAVLFGNEAWGLPDEMRDLADDTVRVPISGSAESLNLAAAATVVLFESARRRAADRLPAMIDRAAHDLRSPLVGVRGFASTLGARWDDLDDRRRRDAVALIAFDAERGAALLELVVAIARADAGGRRGSERGLLEEAGASIERSFGRVDERPDVRWEASGDVALDPRTLHAIGFVLADLASSAAHGPVTVRSQASGDAVAVTAVWEGASSFADDLADEGSLELLRGAATAVGGALEPAADRGLVLRLPL